MELVGERSEIGNFAFGIAELFCDESVETALHRFALASLPDLGQFSKLPERTPELLASRDEL